ncbi:hypothetical protein B0O80DRAFT_456226 [Mortierella sp. GBAus27b]|nr:hypothetical protein B0O80DRAFT_456226 [Mortierella sp. GBAus27b]
MALFLSLRVPVLALLNMSVPVLVHASLLVHDSILVHASLLFHDSLHIQCLSIEGHVKSNGNTMKLIYSIVRGHQQLWASHSTVHRCTNRLDR